MSHRYIAVWSEVSFAKRTQEYRATLRRQVANKEIVLDVIGWDNLQEMVSKLLVEGRDSLFIRDVDTDELFGAHWVDYQESERRIVLFGRDWLTPERVPELFEVDLPDLWPVVPTGTEVKQVNE